MLYPETLRENEFVRLVALRRDKDGKVIRSVVEYVQSFEEYAGFVQKYRYNYDVYNQLATNRGRDNGTVSSQRLRRVLFLDFDRKDYSNLKEAQDFTNHIKEKLPRLFLHACTDSGHGFHYYISVKANVGDFDDVIEINKELVSFLGADCRAASKVQIDRPPCTFNHKLDDGTYDYENKEKWSYVKVVTNAYMKGKCFKSYDIPYVRRQIKVRQDEQETQEILEKIDWKYEQLDDYPRCLCTRKVLNEGIEKGQRNFWHGRIVKMLQMEGYQESKIYAMCQEWNVKCRPPKSKDEVEKDSKRYLETDYKLLGCYESIKDKAERQWVEEQCDKSYCGTHHNGAKISIEEGGSVKINKSVLTNYHLRTMTGNGYLILTLLDVYGDSFGRRGFRIKNLKELLYSSIQKKQCINDRLLKKTLLFLSEQNWIDIKPDKKSSVFDENKLILNKRLKEFRKGYIEFYFSIANALIDGKINQTHYLVFIALLRNLSEGKSVTYEQLGEDLIMDVHNVRKYIKKLQLERCLIINKGYNEKGNEFNRYRITSPEFFQALAGDKEIPFDDTENIVDESHKEILVTLLA